VTITSYAQNFEDVILWRVLQHVKCGFYIDIGAQDPVIDSVSLAFYENGWRGTHVEPTAHYARALREARPDEEVIEAAIGAEEQTIIFFEFPDTGLSTGEELIARAHEARGHALKRTSVPALPLFKILDAHKEREIHWLKIDVEGMECQVIKSWYPSDVRPWVVLVESTKPNSSEPAFEDWHTDLEALGYEFVYFDGINRFYLSKEHPELRSGFLAGPNVFDDFVLSGTASSQFCSRVTSETDKLRKELTLVTSETDKLRKELTSRVEEVVSLSQALRHAESDASLQRAKLEHSQSIWKEANAKLIAEVALKAQSLAEERVNLVSLTRTLATEQAAAIHLRRELDAVYKSTSWAITAPLRTFSIGARWLVRGLSAWLLLKPGSRPRRVASAAALVLFRRLSRQASHSQRLSQEGTRHQSKVPLQELRPTDHRSEESDTVVRNAVYDISVADGEPEAVRRVYWQLVRARRDVLAS
jgi:FkbM family methyltransferase